MPFIPLAVWKTAPGFPEPFLSFLIFRAKLSLAGRISIHPGSADEVITILSPAKPILYSPEIVYITYLTMKLVPFKSKGLYEVGVGHWSA
jgi:hypothetical protein